MHDGVNTAKVAQPKWADAKVGQRLEGVEVTIDWTIVALQVSGSQDWNRVHHDPDFALESGHPSIFLNTGWTSALVFRVASDWIGVSGWIERFELRMRQMNVFGDNVRSGGQVRDKRIDSEGRRVVDLDLWLENDRVGRTTVASAVAVFRTPAGDVE
jgi:acyl dehydratase